MRCIISLIKIYPIVVTLSITIGLLCAITGVSISNFTYPIFGHSLLMDMMILIMSIRFKFCKWHQILILNLIAIISIEWLSVNVGFIPDTHDYIATLTALMSITILISTILYYKHGCFKTTPKKIAR